MSDNFQTNIQQWVNVDNNIKKLQKELKEFRNTKHELTQNIFTYAESNNLENAVIQISDGKLKFQNIKTTSPLTFSFIESCLKDLIEDETKVKDIIKYIKQKRIPKYNYDIKRSYK
mgnify:CR=1 FL=1|tara:strand:- start:1578 stop:1925 length:348 start_codon:yes stop_codon:yes gene_type:complete